MLKIKIIIAIVYFLFWYVIALISARDIDEKKTLGITDDQWTALAVICLPIPIIFAG